MQALIFFGEDSIDNPGHLKPEENFQWTAGTISVHNSGANFRMMKVPDGHCFVLGDNRGNSRDSRQLGPIPLRDVMGRVEYIYLPAEIWSRFGVFGNSSE